MRPVICVVDRLYKRSKDTFDAAGDLEFVTVGRTEAEMQQGIRDSGAKAVVLATDPYTDALYATLPKGGLIARYGVGHDNVDKALATRRGQFVTITPGVLDISVAEHAMTLLTASARRVAQTDAALKQNQWPRSAGNELAGSTLAVIGCGKIGKRVARIAAFGYDMRVLGVDVADLDPATMRREYGIEMASSLDEALARADFVSIHLPALPETRHFVDAAFLEKMPDGATIINTARGSLVEENALFNEVSKGRINAALDVYETEPYRPQDPERDLRRLPDIIMTPHVGSSTTQASTRMAERVIRNIRDWMNGTYTDLDLVNTDVLTTAAKEGPLAQ